jgi:hypothetical protein
MISDYQFDIVLSCFCPPSGQRVRTEVHARVATLTHVDGTPVGIADPKHDVYVRYSTVEGIFAAIVEELSRDDRTADATGVSFDPVYGYPTGSFVYQRVGPDAEIRVAISAFTALGK